MYITVSITQNITKGGWDIMLKRHTFRPFNSSKILLSLGAIGLIYLVRLSAKRGIRFAGTKGVMNVMEDTVEALNRAWKELGKMLSEIREQKGGFKKRIQLSDKIEHPEEISGNEMVQLKEKIAYLENQLAEIKARL
jgi:hypothetical protein